MVMFKNVQFAKLKCATRNCSNIICELCISSIFRKKSNMVVAQFVEKVVLIHNTFLNLNFRI